MGSVGTNKGNNDYHTFDTLSRNSHHYVSDNGATERFFEQAQNLSELYPEVLEHSRAFDAWISGNPFMSGIQYDGFSNMPRYAQEYTRAFDSVLDRATLNTSIEVHRRATSELIFGKGVKRFTEDDLRNMVGNEVISMGNMSTGAAAEGLTIGSGSDKPIDYVFRIPAGSTGAGLYIGHHRVNDSFGDEQREFMMNRDTSFRVVGYERIPDSEREAIRSRSSTWSDDDTPPRYRVILEYTGLLDHDYS